MRAICRIAVCITLFTVSVIWAAMDRVQAADALVTNVRVGDHVDKTRFVMEMSRGLNVRFFMLDNPYRIVLDFEELGWQLPAGPLPGPAGVYKAMRYGLYQPGQSRVVVETNTPVGVQSAFYLSPLGNGSQRFVMDLIPIARSQFLASLDASIPIDPTGQGYVNSAISNDNGATITTKTDTATPSSASASDSIELSSVTLSASGMLMVPKRKPLVPVFTKRVVVLDAGHGGVDPGTIGKSGVYEKHVTIAAARIFKTHLEESGRYKVVLTRNRDVFIPLRDRVAAARRAGGDLFISIHADSIKNSSVSGASVYTLSEKASDKEAALLAEKENKADVIAGMDFSTESQEVTNILIDLAQREAMNQSSRYAGMLVKDLQRTSKVLSRAHRFAGFAVLKAPDVPSVLIELGFLSNTRDEKNLRSKAYLRKIAQALLSATDRYFARVQQATVN